MTTTATIRLLLPAVLAGAWAVPAAAAPITIPKGTIIEVKTVSPVDAATVKKGERVLTVVYPAVYIGDRQAMPRMAVIWAQVKHVRTPADGAKSAALALKFEELRIGKEKWDIEGVLTSLQRDDSKKILEHQAKMATGRKIDVVLIGAGTEATKRASMLVGTSGENREDLADEWAASGLGPGYLVVVPDTVLAMRLERSLTLEEAHGQPPATPDRVIVTASADVRRAQQSLKRLGLYRGPVNGTLDEPTRRAIASFQIDKEQPATGDLDRETVAALASGPARPRPAASPAAR
jgi:hypothetical protein